MTFPELAYIGWAKSLPRVDVNLARSGVDLCPPSLLRLDASDLVATLPVKYGYAPLREAIAARYGAAFDRVFPVSGGTSYANWLACLAALDGCGRGTEVIVERPTYEPLLKIPWALGYRVRRFDRRFEDGYAIDLDRFASLVTAKTRLAVVTNLHNPSGARIPMATLRAMAALLARVKAYLLPSAIDSDRFVRHLVKSDSTLVVPGRFFEAPRHIRLSFGCRPSLLARGLANISRALDDLS